MSGTIKKIEWYTIPNMMGYFRILLIPLFAYLYCSAQTTTGYYIAAGVIGISALTDLVDGYIARTFDMVTELGKFLDPLADKLTHGVIILCLASRYSMMWWLVLLFVIKEGFMLVMGAIMLRQGKKLDGAKWFGKVCTALLFLALFMLLLFPTLSLRTVNLLIAICAIWMVVTLLLYIPEFIRMGKE